MKRRYLANSLVAGIILSLAGNAPADCNRVRGQAPVCGDPYCYSDTCPMSHAHCCRVFGNVGALELQAPPKVAVIYSFDHGHWKDDWTGHS